MRFWEWFFRGLKKEDGTRSRSGLGSYLSKWLILQIAVGVVLSIWSPLSLQDAGQTVFLPLVGILVGLSFAWGGSANALMQSDELMDLAEHVDGGMEKYMYVFQAAILSLFVVLVIWGLAALGWADHVWPRSRTSVSYQVVEIIVYSTSAIALRECWHVILGVQSMLLGKINLRRERKKRSRQK